MNNFAVLYLSELSDRDLACIKMVLLGVLALINIMVFIKHHNPAADVEIKQKDQCLNHPGRGGSDKAINIWIPAAWYDEAFTILITRLPIAQTILATAGDVHPPLYYVLVYPLAGNLLFLRLFSVILSLAAIVAVWYITWLLKLPDLARIITVCLVSIMPTEIYYAQEARMYALLQLLVLIQFIFLIKQQWWWLSLLTLLCLYTHNYGIYYSFIIYSIAIVMHIIRQHNIRIFKIVISGLIPLVLFTPWIVVLATQMHQLEPGYWITPTTLGSMLYDLLQIVMSVYLPDVPVVVMPAGIALGMLLSAVIWYGIKQSAYTELNHDFCRNRAGADY